MEGTETEWGRPADPPPRWRALLDRARHGGRTGEQTQVGRDEPPDAGSALADAHLTGHNGGRDLGGRDQGGGDNGGSGHASSDEESLEARQRKRGYFDTGLAAGQSASDGRTQSDVDLPVGASRYAALDPRYLDEPRLAPSEPPSSYAAPESRYAALDTGYAPAPPVLPLRSPIPRQTAPAESGYAPPVPAQSGYAPPVPVQSGLAPPVPTQSSYAPAAPPTEPRYAPPLSDEAAYAPTDRFPAKGAGVTSGSKWRQSTRDPETERAIGVLRRDMGHPRVLAFANPKGGVHKTTATVLAAATVGSVRGKGVLAWDDNELRGTLGLRAGSARHARTVRHLITELAQIENSHGEELHDRLDDFLRHAADGSYDVLAGEENPRFAHRLDQQTVRRVLELLRRTHDVICVDTGNNVESANWQTVLQAADQLVVTTVPREDAAFTADWMLDLLDDVGMGDLVANAVTLLSCSTPGPPALLEDLKRHFASRTRAVAVVPYDPMLETGSSIEYDQLLPETRDAWLRAASMMLEPFAR